MKLGDKDRAQVIDMLCERLAFERSSVGLYDRVVVALSQSTEEATRDLLPTMQEHRRQEDEHARWLEERIRALGGDTRADTDLARVATRESRGIQEVIENDAADVRHLLHALLAAEAVDHAGWDLLVHLADEAGDHGAKRELEKRMKEEQRHLTGVRDAIQRLAIRSMFGAEYPVEHALDLAASIPP